MHKRSDEDIRNDMNRYPVFTVEELSSPYKLSRVTLPTKNEVLRFVLSRTGNNGNLENNQAVKFLAREVVKIWNDADCCPCCTKYFLINSKHRYGISTIIYYEKNYCPRKAVSQRHR